jgi:hypothetical protein
MRENEERWKELCRQASVEQDPKKLSDLVREIDELLSQKQRRLEAGSKDAAAKLGKAGSGS